MAVGGRDEYGNAVTVGGVRLKAHIRIQPHAASRQQPIVHPLAVADRQHGAFEVAHVMKVAGDFVVRTS